MRLIDDLFEYAGIILIIVNACLYLISYNSYKGVIAYKFFCAYLVFTALIMAVSFTMATYTIDNLYLSHFYFIFQFLFLSLFYKSLFSNTQKRYVTIVLFIVLVTLIIQYILNPKIFFKFNLLEIFLTSFPLVVYSIFHLYNSLNKSAKYMYINAGILIYLTTSTLIFILGDYLSTFLNSQAVKDIWFVNKVLYVVYLILILFEWKQSFLPHKNK